MAEKENGDAGKPKSVAEEIEALWEVLDGLQREHRNIRNAIGHLRTRVRTLEGHEPVMDP